VRGSALVLGLSLLAVARGGCDRHASISDAGPRTAASTFPAPRERPYGKHLPRTWDRARPAPLLVMLHGYGSEGEQHARSLGLTALSDEEGFVLAYPDGLVDSEGRRFWNATNACCDFDGRGVDDVAFVSFVIDDLSSRMPIDPRRVYVVGHSNGGFLAHRLACDLAPRIAAVVSIAGAGWKDPSRCAPSEPVSVLQIHGDADPIIRPGGGRVFDKSGREYPGAEETMKAWATRLGCDPTPHPTGAPLDFDDFVAGPETTAVDFTSCRGGVDVALWTVHGGDHLPHPTHAGLQAVWAWLDAHPKRS
jgi:polyhydroxybutyrate depolymerase